MGIDCDDELCSCGASFDVCGAFCEAADDEDGNSYYRLIDFGNGNGNLDIPYDVTLDHIVIEDFYIPNLMLMTFSVSGNVTI